MAYYHYHILAMGRKRVKKINGGENFNFMGKNGSELEKCVFSLFKKC